MVVIPETIRAVGNAVNDVYAGKVHKTIYIKMVVGNETSLFVYKIAAIGIIITVVCQILKKSDRDDIAMFVSIIGLILVLTVVVGMIGDLFSEIGKVFNLS